MIRPFSATLVPMAKGWTAISAALLVVLPQAAAWAGGLLGPRPVTLLERGAGCGLARSLHLCPAMPRPASGVSELLIRTRRPDQQSYNRLQRLAGALADRMEAGQMGPVKLKFKVILE